ncbi:sensor histidine kinase [Halomonas sp. 1390]|uniref:sensor histidine kinase n=1 Tax=Halomonas sp. B23F22_3 TaxID=3459516 RepID=UPI00373F0ACB
MPVQVYTSALLILAGLWLFGAIHHSMLSRGRPVERSQPLFAVFCALMAGYLIVRALGHHPLAGEALAGLWRVEIVTAAMAFAIVPWLVLACTGARPRWSRAALSLYFLAIALGALGVPAAASLTGEWSSWHATEVQAATSPDPVLLYIYIALLLGLVGVLLDGVLACRRQYRSGASGRLLAIGASFGVFAVGSVLELMWLLGIADTFPAFELSLLPTVVLMSAAVGQDRRLSQDRVQALLDHVPAMVTLKDRDLRYLLVNKAFADEHRLDMDEMRGRTDRELFPSEAAWRHQDAEVDLFAAGDDVETEDRVPSPDGTRFLRSMRFPLYDAKGNPWALGCVSVDVTASRHAELEAFELRRQLAHMDRVTRLDAISASLAHELMQPLAAILNNAQAGLRLQEAHSLSMEQVREVLDDIAADAKRASQVIRTLRDMTRPTETAQETVDLADAVNEVLEMVSADMALKGIACISDLAPNCLATASKSQIQQVILNLLLNALHAVERQPEGDRRIEVRAGLDPSGAVLVAVRDSGTGIAANEIQRLFEPFYSTKPEGMGIGLAVCRNLVEGHDGRIWAEGNEPGPGTTFRFTLPARQSTFESPRAASGVNGS